MIASKAASSPSFVLLCLGFVFELYHGRNSKEMKLLRSTALSCISKGSQSLIDRQIVGFQSMVSLVRVCRVCARKKIKRRNEQSQEEAAFSLQR
jgi:hypothetical protein